MKLCPCGNSFEVWPSKAHRARTCSTPCKYKFRRKRSGTAYVIKQRNPSWFKRGHAAWNAGTIGLIKPNSGSFKKGEHPSPATEFKAGNVPIIASEKRRRGHRHPMWKGDAVGYNALHGWVARTLGIPKECCKCGVKGSRRKIHWANKSGRYLRNSEDWMPLCGRCHRKHDKAIAGASKREFQTGGLRQCVV